MNNCNTGFRHNMGVDRLSSCLLTTTENGELDSGKLTLELQGHMHYCVIGIPGNVPLMC